MAEEEEEGQTSHPSVPQSSATDPPPPPQAVGTSCLGSSQLSSAGGHGQGLYAVQFSPFTGMMPKCPPSVLIPLTYNIPTRTNSTGAAGEEQGQGGEAARQHQHGPQRQVVVRRFQLAFQLDLALLLKLAFAVFLFGQDGSRQRTIVLVLLASLIYLYQTGVLTPLIRYARQGLAPPRPPVRPQNAAAARPNDQQPDNAGGNENQEQPAEGSNPPQPQPEQPEAEQEREQRANGINLWGIAREIQTFIVGFITSLLPGFEQRPHND